MDFQWKIYIGTHTSILIYARNSTSAVMYKKQALSGNWIFEWIAIRNFFVTLHVNKTDETTLRYSMFNWQFIKGFVVPLH